jgi:hypothetical protein
VASSDSGTTESVIGNDEVTFAVSAGADAGVGTAESRDTTGWLAVPRAAIDANNMEAGDFDRCDCGNEPTDDVRCAGRVDAFCVGAIIVDVADEAIDSGIITVVLVFVAPVVVTAPPGMRGVSITVASDIPSRGAAAAPVVTVPALGFGG